MNSIETQRRESGTLPRFNLWLGGLVLIALSVFYARFLHSYFLFDDLSLLSIYYLEANNFTDALRPFGNGFWRPTATIPIYLLANFFGPIPFIFRIFSWAALFAVAVLAGLVIREIGVLHKRSLHPFCIIAPVLILSHNLTWSVAVPWQNINDSLYTLFLLLSLLFWMKRERGGTHAYYCFSLLCYLLALASKETAILFWPGLLLYETLNHRGEKWRQQLQRALPLLPFAVASLLFFGAALALQTTSENSYINAGQGNLNPIAFAKAYGRYLFGVAYPFVSFSHIGPWATLGHPLMVRAAQGLFILFLAVITAKAWQKKSQFRAEIVSSVFIGGLLALPTGLIAFGNNGRYLFGPMVFLVIAVCLVLSTHRSQIFAQAFLWVAIALHIGSLFLTQQYRDYARASNQAERFVHLVRHEAARWEEGDRVLITNFPHPDPGDEGLHWVYCQTLMRLALPDMGIVIAIGGDYEVDHRYNFDQTRLYRID